MACFQNATHLFDKKMVTADKLIAMQFKKLTSQARIYSTQ